MINYNKIEKLLNETLEKETPESLKTWLDSKKREERLADLGEGEYQFLETEHSSFSHEPNIANADTPVVNTYESNYYLAA